MSAETTPPTTQTPAAPAAPSKPTSTREAVDRIIASEGSQPSQGTSTGTTTPSTQGTPAPAAGSTPAAPAKPKRTFKFDHTEEEVDATWLDDEAKWTRLKEYAERGYGHERVVKRTQSETAEAVRIAWNKLLAKNGFDVVQDPSDTEFGWKVVQRQQAATPAAQTPADPLAKEEADLIPLAEQGDVNAILRLRKIDHERAKLAAASAKDAAIQEWESRQREAAAKAAAEREAKDNYERAEKYTYDEIDRRIAARAKSFDGPNAERHKARIRSLAFEAARAAAGRGEDFIKAAQSVVFDEADDMDARERHYRDTLPTAPNPPASAPVVGTTPAGGAGPTKPKTMQEALDLVTPGWRNGRR